MMSNSGHGGGVGISVGGNGGMVSITGVQELGLSDNVGVVVSDNGCALDSLHNRLAGNGVGHLNGDGLGDMDGGGDLDDSLNVFDDVIGGRVGFLDMDGLVDGVDLLLDLDDGGVDGLGTLQGGGDSDLEVGDGGLQDLGGVSGDVGGLSQVNLFGDDGGGFVDGGHIGFLSLGDVRGGDRDGGGSGNGSGVKKRSGMSQRSGMGQGSGMQERSGHGGDVGGGAKSGGKQGRNKQGVHFVCFVRPEYFQRCN